MMTDTSDGCHIIWSSNGQMFIEYRQKLPVEAFNWLFSYPLWQSHQSNMHPFLSDNLKLGADSDPKEGGTQHPPNLI